MCQCRFVCLFVCLFIYLWLCWVFVSVGGLSLVAANVCHSSSRCAGLSLSRPFLLRSTGSRRAGSVAVAHRPSCSAACGIFPDQGANPCPLHWQADSQPLCHQGSPCRFILGNKCTILVSNFDNEGGSAGVGVGSIWEISVPSSQICCKLKTALKNSLEKEVKETLKVGIVKFPWSAHKR